MKRISLVLFALAALAVAIPAEAQTRLRRESVKVTSTTGTVTATTANIYGLVEQVLIDVSGGTQTVSLVTDDNRTVYSGSAITSDKTATPRVANTDTSAANITNGVSKIPVVGQLTLSVSSASAAGLTCTATIYYTPGE